VRTHAAVWANVPCKYPSSAVTLTHSFSPPHIPPRHSQSLEVRSMAYLRNLGASELPGLTSLVVHDMPHLWSLTSEPEFDHDDLPGLAALSALLDLTITGARPSARVPTSLSALSNLTRLEIASRLNHDNATEEPLFGHDEWLPGRGGASPLAGCPNLRELVITDDGPRLTFPPALMERLTALSVLDLGGVRAPVLEQQRLLTAMPALRRLIVPRGPLQPGLIARLGRRGRGHDVPRRAARFRVRGPPGCDVIVEEVG
jgi:hypothetical protein